MSLAVDLLCGVLTGSNFGKGVPAMSRDYDVPERVGHFFAALDISTFIFPDDFHSRVRDLVDQVKSARRCEGVEEILVPGEPELRKEAHAREHGIKLPKKLAEELGESVVARGLPMWDNSRET